jgi:hypothetical protein
VSTAHVEVSIGLVDLPFARIVSASPEEAGRLRALIGCPGTRGRMAMEILDALEELAAVPTEIEAA